MYWLRSVFWRKQDFVFRDDRGVEVEPGRTRKWVLRLLTVGAFVGVFVGKDWLREELPRQLREFDVRTFAKSLNAGRV